MGTLRDKRIYDPAHTLRFKKRNVKGFDSILERFQNCPFAEGHRSRMDGTKHSAHSTTKFQKKIIHTCAPQKSIKDDNSWVVVLNCEGKNGPMKQHEDHAKAIRIKERLYEESGEGRTKIPSQQTRTDGILLMLHQARLRHGGNHQTNGGRHRVGSLAGDGDSLVSDGVCKHYTKPTHI